MTVRIMHAMEAGLVAGAALLLGLLTRPGAEPYVPDRLVGDWAARFVEDASLSGRSPMDTGPVAGTIRLEPRPDDYPEKSMPPAPGSHAELDLARFGLGHEGGAVGRVETRTLGRDGLELRLPDDGVVMRGRVSGDSVTGVWWHEIRFGRESGRFTLRRTSH